MMVVDLLKKIRSYPALSLMVFFLVMAFQIQVTLFSSDDYLGLRVNLADFFVPLFGLFVLFSLLLKRTLWPQFYFSRGYLWVFALAGVMSISFAHGYFDTGRFSSWGFVNKYIGFLILMAYFMLGAWIIGNSEKPSDLLLRVLSVFCTFIVFIIALSCVCVFLPEGLWLAGYPWDGLMANRNAFMVAAIFALVVICVSYSRGVVLFPAWVYGVFWFSVPFFALYNDSRTGWIVGGVIILVFLVRKPIVFIQKILPFVLLGAVLVYSTIYVVNNPNVIQGNQYQYLKQLALEGATTYSGDEKRFISVEDGLELYGQSNFLLGSGLGTYRDFQIQKRGEFIDLIDFTALWLLVETGILGIAVFSIFFLVCLWVLYKRGFSGENPSFFHRCVFFFMICFFVMSCLHELMYTRFLWFMLGLGLGVPNLEKKVA